MAGAHPSSGADWQSQSASQSAAYQQSVGSQITDARASFMGGSVSSEAPAAAEAAPSSAQAPESAVSLAASSTQSEAEATHWSSVQLVACIFAGFSLPAALAFVSTLRKPSRSSIGFEETGFQRLIDV